MSKKAKYIILSVVIFIMLAGCGVMGYLLYSSYSKDYNQGDLNNAIAAGKAESEEYAKSLNDLITKLAEQVKQSQENYKALEKSYDETTAKLQNEIDKQINASIAQTAEYLQSLKNIRSTYASLKAANETELTDLNTQLIAVNKDIADISGLEGDYASELAGLNSTKRMLENGINNCNNNISRITAQISELDKLIAELEAMQTPAGA